MFILYIFNACIHTHSLFNFCYFIIIIFFSSTEDQDLSRPTLTDPAARPVEELRAEPPIIEASNVIAVGNDATGNDDTPPVPAPVIYREQPQPQQSIQLQLRQQKKHRLLLT